MDRFHVIACHILFKPEQRHNFCMVIHVRKAMVESTLFHITCKFVRVVHARQLVCIFSFKCVWSVTWEYPVSITGPPYMVRQGDSCNEKWNVLTRRYGWMHHEHSVYVTAQLLICPLPVFLSLSISLCLRFYCFYTNVSKSFLEVMHEVWFGMSATSGTRLFTELECCMAISPVMVFLPSSSQYVC